MTSLADLVDVRTVMARYDAADDESVIRALADRLEQVGAVAASFADAAIERERSSPTGLSMGEDAISAAIPHAEREHVLRPAVAVATLARAVPFRRMDDPSTPVLVSLIVMPAFESPDGQLGALQAISGMLQDGPFMADLMEQTTAEGLLAVLQGRRT